MISSQDRAGWFGASDTAKIMGRWDTKTFARFWAEKLGLIRNNFANSAMLAGTYYEHRILDVIGAERRDRQIKIRPLRLRVNLDGETGDLIHEVKTYGGECFKVSPTYWQQCQVQMFATGKRCEIVAYRLLPDDYNNYFNDIDHDRLSFHSIEYDGCFIEEELKLLQYLQWCLKKGKFPNRRDVQ